MNWMLEECFSEIVSAGESAAQLVHILQKTGQTAATAESCTGGMVASQIVSIAGASEVFENGFITYCDQAKERLLQVSPQTLAAHTAVSAETAAEMASGSGAVRDWTGGTGRRDAFPPGGTGLYRLLLSGAGSGAGIPLFGQPGGNPLSGCCGGSAAWVLLPAGALSRFL